MHSSRMRTGRSLTVCWGCLLPGVGDVPGLAGMYLVLGGVCLLPGVCVYLGVVYLVLEGGLLPGGGWYLVPGLGGGGIPACTEADTPPVNRMTDRCKNITLATTSLRPVTTDLDCYCSRCNQKLKLLIWNVLFMPFVKTAPLLRCMFGCGTRWH